MSCNIVLEITVRGMVSDHAGYIRTSHPLMALIVLFHGVSNLHNVLNCVLSDEDPLCKRNEASIVLEHG